MIRGGCMTCIHGALSLGVEPCKTCLSGLSASWFSGYEDWPIPLEELRGDDDG